MLTETNVPNGTYRGIEGRAMFLINSMGPLGIYRRIAPGFINLGFPIPENLMRGNLEALLQECWTAVGEGRLSSLPEWALPLKPLWEELGDGFMSEENLVERILAFVPYLVIKKMSMND